MGLTQLGITTVCSGSSNYQPSSEEEEPMPDYTACANRDCSWRSDCARFLMKWGPRQSVSIFTAEMCEMHLPRAEASWPLLSLTEALAQVAGPHEEESPPRTAPQGVADSH